MGWGGFLFKSDSRGKVKSCSYPGLRELMLRCELFVREKRTDFDPASVGRKGLAEKTAFVGTIECYADLEYSSIKGRRGGCRSKSTQERARRENTGDLHIDFKKKTVLYGELYRLLFCCFAGVWAWGLGRLVDLWDWFFKNVGERLLKYFLIIIYNIDHTLAGGGGVRGHIIWSTKSSRMIVLLSLCFWQ